MWIVKMLSAVKLWTLICNVCISSRYKLSWTDKNILEKLQIATVMKHLSPIQVIYLRHMNLRNLDSKNILETFQPETLLKHFLLTLVIIFRHSNLRTRNIFLRHIIFRNLNNRNIGQTATLMIKHLFPILVIYLRSIYLRNLSSFHHQQPRSSCLQLDFSHWWHQHTFLHVFPTSRHRYHSNEISSSSSNRWVRAYFSAHRPMHSLRIIG